MSIIQQALRRERSDFAASSSFVRMFLKGRPSRGTEDSALERRQFRSMASAADTDAGAARRDRHGRARHRALPESTRASGGVGHPAKFNDPASRRWAQRSFEFLFIIVVFESCSFSG